MASAGYIDSGMQSLTPPIVPYSPGQARSVGGIKPLSRSEVQAQLQLEISDSLGSYGSQVHERRRTNLRRYEGKPIGNEVKGSSQAQINVVQDTVEWMMPSIMKAIFGPGTNIWEFDPILREDEDYSEQAADAVNHIFLEECDGWKKMYEFVKTALLEIRGYLAIYWDDRLERQKEHYRGLSHNGIGMLMQDQNLEVLSIVPHQGEIQVDPMTGMPAETFDVMVRRTTPLGKIRIDSIAPENMLLPRGETEIDDDTRFCGYRKEMTVSELISLGYDPDIVSVLPRSNRADFSNGQVDRLYQENAFAMNTRERGDGASRMIWVNWIWIRLDEDGDGYAELRQIVCVGDSTVTIISDREVNHIPIVSICPIPSPHKFHGECPAGQVSDIQVIQSTILRQQLDNFYRVNNSRYEVVEGMVNLKDLMSNKPGGGVRVTAAGSITPLATAALPNSAFELMNFMQGVAERRTGVSSWQQGPDAADMKYQTGGAVSQVQTASESKITLINKIFEQTGVKKIGQKILQLMCENYAGPFTYRLRGSWVECDPRSWNSKMRVKVRTGLGVGEMEAAAQRYMMVINLQKEALLSGASQMVSPRNLYNAFKGLMNTMSMGLPGDFFTDPGQAPWPEPEPALEDQVKLMESQRRTQENIAQDAQSTMTLAVKSAQAEELDAFRYADLRHKERMALASLESQQQIAKMQMDGAIRAAMIQQKGGMQDAA